MLEFLSTLWNECVMMPTLFIGLTIELSRDPFTIGWFTLGNIWSLVANVIKQSYMNSSGLIWQDLWHPMILIFYFNILALGIGKFFRLFLLLTHFSERLPRIHFLGLVLLNSLPFCAFFVWILSSFHEKGLMVLWRNMAAYGVAFSIVMMIQKLFF